MRKHVILVGMSGSGKSTVGRLIAELLGAPFIDVDETIEKMEHRSIPEIFAEFGEEPFRERERDLVDRALDNDPSVIVPGGGWATRPGNVDGALTRSLILYLRTEPGTAAARLHGSADRPLLDRADVEGSLRAQLAVREPNYLRAASVVQTDDLTPDEVAGIAAALARETAGW